MVKTRQPLYVSLGNVIAYWLPWLVSFWIILPFPLSSSGLELLPLFPFYFPLHFSSNMTFITHPLHPLESAFARGFITRYVHGFPMLYYSPSFSLKQSSLSNYSFWPNLPPSPPKLPPPPPTRSTTHVVDRWHIPQWTLEFLSWKKLF